MTEAPYWERFKLAPATASPDDVGTPRPDPAPDVTGEPISRVSALPEWPDDWLDPERPRIRLSAPGRRSTFDPDTTYAVDVTAAFQDTRSAEWFAHWLTTRNAYTAYTAYLAWLDSRR